MMGGSGSIVPNRVAVQPYACNPRAATPKRSGPSLGANRNAWKALATCTSHTSAAPDFLLVPDASERTLQFTRALRTKNAVLRESLLLCAF